MPEETSLEKITELLLKFLDGLNKPERMETIDTLIHRLQFERHAITSNKPLLKSWADLGKKIRDINRTHEKQKV